MAAPVFAQPDIEILSPMNTTYSQSKILVNVTSSEAVDFYIEYNSNKVVMATDTTNLENYLYVKEGNYNFTIYANNSNGTASDSVIFTEASEEPPINVTSCGILSSSDTSYKLVNDVSSSYVCFYLYDENITFDLNGKNVDIYGGPTAISASCKNSRIFNGTFTNEEGGSFRFIDSAKCIIRDIEADTQNFAEIQGANGILFERINSNVLNWAFFCEFSTCNIVIKNSTFNASEGEVFFQEAETFFSKVIIENSFIQNFLYPIYADSYFSDYYMRNTYIDTNAVQLGYGYKRIFVQHLIKLNVTEEGEGIAASVEILDTSDLPTISPEEIEYTLVANPTSNFSVATDENGLAETWLTERTIVHASFSPAETYEYNTPVYNLTAKSKNTTSTQVLNMSGYNSTFKVSMNVSIPKLPPCGLDEMFDLNDDDSVNINDAIIMLRRITGLPVNTTGNKKCEARNFFITE